MIDPRSEVVREVFQRMGQPLQSRSDLRQLLDQFVMLLTPKKEFAELIAEALVRTPELESIKSPAALRMAAAITLSSIGKVDVEADGSDQFEPPRLPLIRTRWLNRLRVNLLRVRIALEKSFGVRCSPLLDSVEERIVQYIWAILACHRLSWARDEDMPPALEGVLTELVVEASVGLPALADELFAAVLAVSGAEGMERLRLGSRVEHSIKEGLRNDPAPNDLRHYREQLQRSSLLVMHKPDTSDFEAPTQIVGSDDPPRFFAANLESAWFVQTARSTPPRVRALLRAS